MMQLGRVFFKIFHHVLQQAEKCPTFVKFEIRDHNYKSAQPDDEKAESIILA
jgi:hypothetical protein